MPIELKVKLMCKIEKCMLKNNSPNGCSEFIVGEERHKKCSGDSWIGLEMTTNKIVFFAISCFHFCFIGDLTQSLWVLGKCSNTELCLQTFYILF